MSNNNNNDESSSFSLDSLPEGFLADIVPFLSTSDGANFTSTNSLFYGEVFRGQVLNQVTRLDIKGVLEMRNTNLGRIFPSVTTIEFRRDDDEFFQLLIPFLASFPNLQKIEFTLFSRSAIGIVLQVPDVEGGLFVRPAERLLRTLGDAYAAGTLSERVQVVHPLCPVPHPPGSLCDTCIHVIRTFPPKHILTYDKERQKLIFKLLDPPSFVQESGRLSIEDGANDKAGRDWPITDREINEQFVARPGGREAMMQCFLAMQDEE